MSQTPFSNDELTQIVAEESSFSIDDSPYSKREILTALKLADVRRETKIKDLDLSSVEKDFKWRFKQGLLSIDDLREAISNIVVDTELADALGDNIVAEAKGDFALDILEALTSPSTNNTGSNT